MFEEVARCLLETVDRLGEFENKTISSFHTLRLLNIDIFIRFQIGMNKSSGDIGLSSLEAELG
jgi:hypothetical protein